MKIKLFLVGCGLSLGVASSGFAATTTGTINATLTLTTGCLVNGQNDTTDLDLGDIDFGTSAATFDTLNTQLVSTVGNGIYVLCSPDQSFNVQVTASNTEPTTVYGTETASPRYLLLGTDATQGIAYTLYSDAAFSNAIANDTPLTAGGTTSPTLGTNFPIYGQITGGGFNAAIPVGTYTDTISVAVNY